MRLHRAFQEFEEGRYKVGLQDDYSVSQAHETNFKYQTAAVSKSIWTSNNCSRQWVFYVGINSPGKRNAVNLETACQLFEAFSDFNENKEAQIAILHGHGGTFCAGFDLKQLGGTQVMNVDEIDRMFEGRAPLVNVPL